VTILLFDALKCFHLHKSISCVNAVVLHLYRGNKTSFNIILKSDKNISGKIINISTKNYFLASTSIFRISDKCSVMTPVEITPFTRGFFNIKVLNINITSPLKLWQYIDKINSSIDLHIFANNRKSIQILHSLYSSENAGIHLRPLTGKGKEVDRLREYITGDSLSDIHWKATAKHGRPITKEYRIERSQSVYVIIDSSRTSSRIVDYLPIGSSEELLPTPLVEHSIVAAEILSMVACRQGDKVGLACFDSKMRMFIKPDSGPKHLLHCRTALTNLTTGTSPADYREMFQYLASTIHNRAMILILADFDDPLASEDFISHITILSKKHAVMGICPVSTSTQPLFSSRIECEEEMYYALSGHLRWQTLKNVQKSINSKGASIIISSYKEITTNLLNAYFRLKRNQYV
jgi:uncharacterized protein (DUF58 family)